MDEREFIIQIFKNAFEGKALNATVLYGLGENTKTIIDAFPDMDIQGLLDGYQTTGACFGKPVLSLDDVIALKIRNIIIIARMNSTKIIVKRISAFCREQNIRLYDIYGNDLLSKDASGNKERPYFSLTKENVEKKILDSEIISFDIFDTLVMRKVLQPTDAFELMERGLQIDGYAKAQVEEERKLYRSGHAANLSEIYDTLKKRLQWTDEQKNKVMTAEFELERKLLVPRIQSIELFNFAQKHNKKVYLISDMYYSKTQIAELMNSCGVNGYEDIFVSSEYNTLKTQRLFDVFQEKIGRISCLHIGDDLDADILAAQRRGMDTVQLKTRVEELISVMAPI